MDHSKRLGEDKISALLLKFSVPAIVGMVVNALYNIVDRIFVGRGVGSLGIAGIAIGLPLMTILLAVGMLIGIGSTALISIRLGQQRREEAERIIGNALVLLIGVSLVISVSALIFIDPLLRLFGASEAVLPFSRAYLRIILFGAVFQIVGFGMNNMIRAEGNPKIAMMTMLIGGILNTILDPIFIFQFKMGIEGAAWATIISQFVSAVWVLSYFLGKRSSLKIRLSNMVPNISIIKGILGIGSAPFAMQVAASILTIILNNSLRIYGGDVAISGMGIINSVSMMILMPIFGINQGAQPIIGFNYEAEKYDRVVKALKLAIIAAISVTTVGFVIIRIFAENLVLLFNNTDQELIRFGAYGLRVFLTFLPVIGFQIVSANYFQAVGKPKQAMFLSLSRQVIILIPALLILPRFFGLNGVLYAGPLADFISSFVTGIWLFLELKQLREKHKESEENSIPELKTV